MFLTRERGLWFRSILYLLLLTLFFFSSYGLANWFTSQRSDVGIVVFSWEKIIPLWSWTIIPYWSIDIFYGLAILLAPSVFQLNILVKRLFSAQVICITCFLIWPLMFSFERPELDGYSGMLFDLLMGFDKPFNQAPSLHITLLVILWVFYAKYLHGIWQWLLHIWFSLIAISVLTTWQHHFFDVPTGLLVGAFCIWLWPAQGASLFYQARYPKQWCWGSIYLIFTAILLTITLMVGANAVWLLWLALALTITALNYYFVGARGFQKQENGRFTIIGRFLLLPYQLIMWGNSRLWTRCDDEFNLVFNKVYLGRIPSRSTLKKHRFSTVVDLCAELPMPTYYENYILVPVLDMAAPSLDECRKGVEAINTGLAHGDVLVCCALGYSRSATIILAWLLSNRIAESLDDAIQILKKARPNSVINAKQVIILNQWIRLLNGENYRH
ncbi:phosphatase PAP2/dual specificity phosphatase family protein [Orbus sturtevantii]|uniref:phosphatase PAP2/dual specificity phosphatase family protein n=1 Tax=Orbus sturtevantii TaxID=3074109 RepID=UPI00370D6715